jgi:hypothetical protein
MGPQWGHPRPGMVADPRRGRPPPPAPPRARNPPGPKDNSRGPPNDLATFPCDPLIRPSSDLLSRMSPYNLVTPFPRLGSPPFCPRQGVEESLEEGAKISLPPGSGNSSPERRSPVRPVFRRRLGRSVVGGYLFSFPSGGEYDSGCMGTISRMGLTGAMESYRSERSAAVQNREERGRA